MNPGQRIKDERLAKGWSQQKLASEISRVKKQKISRVAIAQWESGDSKTQKPENLFAAAGVLGLVPEWVLTGQGTKYQGDKDSALSNSVSQPVGTYTPITLEDRTLLDLSAQLHDEAREIWLKFGAMLTRIPPERRKEDIGHKPERRRPRWESDAHARKKDRIRRRNVK
jgi:transcriptional regulator with XRE-family HTH domain